VDHRSVDAVCELIGAYVDAGYRRAKCKIEPGNDVAALRAARVAFDHVQLAADANGTYSVDEAKKTVTFKITSSTFPNWEGEAQERKIDKLTADEFVNTNPNVAGGRGSASNFYKRVK